MYYMYCNRTCTSHYGAAEASFARKYCFFFASVSSKGWVRLPMKMKETGGLSSVFSSIFGFFEVGCCCFGLSELVIFLMKVISDCEKVRFLV